MTDAIDTATIKTTGQAARTLKEFMTMVADETYIKVDERGMEAYMLDSASVLGYTLRFPAKGMVEHSPATEDRVVGWNMSRVGSILDSAHVGRGKDEGDDVEIVIGNETTDITITTGSGTEHESTVFNIDPDSMREYKFNEGMRNGLNWKVNPDYDDFVGAMKFLTDSYKYIRTEEKDDEFVMRDGDGDDVYTFESQPEPTDSNVSIEDSKHHADLSLFSSNYVKRIAKALDASDMDRVQFMWGMEKPGFWDFSNQNWGINGFAALAPRIQSDEE